MAENKDVVLWTRAERREGWFWWSGENMEQKNQGIPPARQTPTIYNTLQLHSELTFFNFTNGLFFSQAGTAPDISLLSTVEYFRASLWPLCSRIPGNITHLVYRTEQLPQQHIMTFCRQLHGFRYAENS